MKSSQFEKLLSLLKSYEEEGELLDEHEKILVEFIEFFKKNTHFFSIHTLSKRDKKIFIELLLDFGGMQSVSDDFSYGRALELGYGTTIKTILNRITSKWKRWIYNSISFFFSCLLYGLLMKWMISSFAMGVYLCIIFRTIYEVIKYIPLCYVQNEIILNKMNSFKRKKIT